MQKWIMLCLMLEVLAELKPSEKFNQYLIFLTGLILCAAVLEGTLDKAGKYPETVQQRLDRELSRWEEIGRQYEPNMSFKDQLDTVEERAGRLEQEKLLKRLQSMCGGVLEKYGCELTEAYFDEGTNVLSLVLAQKGEGGGRIQIEPIGAIGTTEEEADKGARNKERVEEELEESMNGKGVDCRIEVIFTD